MRVSPQRAVILVLAAVLAGGIAPARGVVEIELRSGDDTLPTAQGTMSGMVFGRVNRTVLRREVIVVGFGVAAYYFVRLYSPAEFHIGGE